VTLLTGFYYIYGHTKYWKIEILAFDELLTAVCPILGPRGLVNLHSPTMSPATDETHRRFLQRNQVYCLFLKQVFFSRILEAKELLC
jgi:hypothetical protein